MVLEIIGTLFMVIIIAFIVNTFENIKNKYNSSISFKESMDLVELPVVTFKQGNKKLNFLLDTGSNYSTINERILLELKHRILPETQDIFGMDGNPVACLMCEIPLSYKKKNFNESFSVYDLNKSFEIIKTDSGVTIHGILGNRFFEKYKYVLDFKDMVAYTK